MIIFSYNPNKWHSLHTIYSIKFTVTYIYFLKPKLKIDPAGKSFVHVVANQTSNQGPNDFFIRKRDLVNPMHEKITSTYINH